MNQQSQNLTDVVAEAFSCLPSGQAAQVAASAREQAFKLESTGRPDWALVWRAVGMAADIARVRRLESLAAHRVNLSRSELGGCTGLPSGG